jgi:hypothetical protein
MEHPAASERRKKERKICRRACDGCPQIHGWRDNCALRPQRDRSKCSDVRTQRALIVGAAVDVIENNSRQSSLGKTAEVVNRHDAAVSQARHAQSSFHGLLANTASSGQSARLGMSIAAMIVAAMSTAYSLFGLLRPVLPPKFV